MKLSRKKIFVFIIILVVLYIIIYIIPKVTGALVSTYTVQYGEFLELDKVDGYFVRSEKVYVAGTTGEANYYFKNNELVRMSTKIMDVTAPEKEKTATKSSGGKAKEGETPIDREFEPIVKNLGENVTSTSNYMAEKEGLISFYCDGREAKFSPENMDKLKHKHFADLDPKDIVKLKRADIVKGEPVFKLVDRSKWYVVFYVDKDSGKNYEQNGYVTVRIDNQDFGGIVQSVNKEDDKYKVIVKCDEYFDKLTSIRVSKIQVITSRSLGLILENSSITKKKGITGVYVKDKVGEFKFVPVKLIFKGKDKSVVYKRSFYDKDGVYTISINTYDEILKTPKD